MIEKTTFKVDFSFIKSIPANRFLKNKLDNIKPISAASESVLKPVHRAASFPRAKPCDHQQ